MIYEDYEGTSDISVTLELDGQPLTAQPVVVGRSDGDEHLKLNLPRGEHELEASGAGFSEKIVVTIHQDGNWIVVKWHGSEQGFTISQEQDPPFFG